MAAGRAPSHHLERHPQDGRNRGGDRGLLGPEREAEEEGRGDQRPGAAARSGRHEDEPGEGQGPRQLIRPARVEKVERDEGHEPPGQRPHPERAERHGRLDEERPVGSPPRQDRREPDHAQRGEDRGQQRPARPFVGRVEPGDEQAEQGRVVARGVLVVGVAVERPSEMEVEPVGARPRHIGKVRLGGAQQGMQRGRDPAQHRDREQGRRKRENREEDRAARHARSLSAARSRAPA